MRRRKVVKYKKQFLITVEGKTDTVEPNEPPFGLETFETMIREIVKVSDEHFKHRSVTIKEINNG